jgi:hypothetical protein
MSSILLEFKNKFFKSSKDLYDSPPTNVGVETDEQRSSVLHPTLVVVATNEQRSSVLPVYIFNIDSKTDAKYLTTLLSSLPISSEMLPSNI